MGRRAAVPGPGRVLQARVWRRAGHLPLDPVAAGLRGGKCFRSQDAVSQPAWDANGQVPKPSLANTFQYLTYLAPQATGSMPSCFTETSLRLFCFAAMRYPLQGTWLEYRRWAKSLARGPSKPSPGTEPKANEQAPAANASHSGGTPHDSPKAHTPRAPQSTPSQQERLKRLAQAVQEAEAGRASLGRPPKRQRGLVG